MSHTTKIKAVAIKDISALRNAVATLKTNGVDCELVQKSTPRMYYRQQEQEIGVCDYVLKLNKSRYDVGFVKQKDGSYSPVLDEFANEIRNQIGTERNPKDTAEQNSQTCIGKLMQLYAKEVTLGYARDNGFMVDNMQTTKDGSLVLTISVM